MLWLKRGAPWLWALLLLRPAVARAADEEGTRSLLSDVARVVAAEEVDDWFADREALRAIEEHLLPSVCHASPEARSQALAQLKATSERLGDAKQLFQTRGEVSDEVTRALTGSGGSKARSRGKPNARFGCDLKWVFMACNPIASG
jgi:hypothetical protein